MEINQKMKESHKKVKESKRNHWSKVGKQVWGLQIMFGKFLIVGGGRGVPPPINQRFGLNKTS